MIECPALAESLPVVRDFVERSAGEAGLDEPARFALVLATDEACSNIIEHGYAGREPGGIAVEFRREPDRASVTITDRGRPFEPEDAPPPDLLAALGDRPIGGLGWHLIRSVVDEVRYHADPVAGNRLTLVKRLASADVTPS